MSQLKWELAIASVLFAMASSPTFGQDKPGPRSCERPAKGKLWEPPPSTISDFNAHRHFTNQLDGKGTEAIEDLNQRGRWCVTYKNGTTWDWSGFHIQIVANDSVNQIMEALRSAYVLDGFGKTLSFQNKDADGNYNKEASFDVHSVSNLGKARNVEPGEAVTIEVNTGCWEGLQQRQVPCHYHIEVKSIAGEADPWKLNDSVSRLPPQSYVVGKSKITVKPLIRITTHTDGKKKELGIHWWGNKWAPRDVTIESEALEGPDQGKKNDGLIDHVKRVEAEFDNGKVEAGAGAKFEIYLAVPAGATKLKRISMVIDEKTVSWTAPQKAR